MHADTCRFHSLGYVKKQIFFGRVTCDNQSRGNEGVDGIGILWLIISEEFGAETTQHRGDSLDDCSVDHGYLQSGAWNMSYGT